MTTETTLNEEEIPLEYQVFALCMKQAGAINRFSVEVPPHIVGQIHGKTGLHEFYLAFLDFHKKTGLDVVDPIAFKSWLENETDIPESLGGIGGVSFFLDQVNKIEVASIDSVIKILKVRAAKRQQLTDLQTLKTLLEKKGTKSDTELNEITRITERIRAAESELDYDPFEVIDTGFDIAARAANLTDIPNFIRTPFKKYNQALGYCVDPETEILTKQGWLRYEDLVAKETEIMAYNIETQTMRWETLRGVYYNHKYEGEMVKLTSMNFDAYVTPHHKWAIQKRNRNTVSDPCMVRTYNLPSEGSILRHAKFEDDKEVFSDNFIKLCAWYFTEGSFLDDGYIAIYQSESANAPYVKEIEDILNSLGGELRDYQKPPCALCYEPSTYGQLCEPHYQLWYTNSLKLGFDVKRTFIRPQGLFYTNLKSKKDSTVRSWGISGTDVLEITKLFSGKNKVPSPSFIASLSARQAAIFIETAKKGDGTKGTNQFHQYNKGRMDTYMAIAVIAGLTVTVDSEGTTCTTNQAHASLNKIRRQTEQYSGTIWCPLTYSGYWVARRNGKVYITGNTEDGGYFKGAVHAIVGRSGIGKSTLAKSLCNFWLDEGHSVLFVNFEEAQAHWERILMTQIIGENVYAKAKTWSDNTRKEKIITFTEKLESWGKRLMVRHDPDTSYFEDLELWLRDIIGHDASPDVVVIDTIQSMFTKGGGSVRWAEFEKMMVRLEKLAKDMDAVFIITVQQNTEAAKEKREIVEQRDVGGSTSIVQKCSVVTFLTEKQLVSGDDSLTMDKVIQLQIPKNRITGKVFMQDPPLLRYNDETKSYEDWDELDDPDAIYGNADTTLAIDALGLGDFNT